MVELIDSTELKFEYKGETRVLDANGMNAVLDEIEQLKYIFTNEHLKQLLSTHKVFDAIEILSSIKNDVGETILIYMKLLDKNLVSESLNITGTPILNSDKLSIFGTVRVDVNDVLLRLKKIVSALELIHLNKAIIQEICGLEFSKSILSFENDITYTDLPEEIKLLVSEDAYNFTEKKLDYSYSMDEEGNLIITFLTSISGTYIIETNDKLFITSKFVSDEHNKLIIDSKVILKDSVFGFVIIVEGYKIVIDGIMIALNLSSEKNKYSGDFTLFGLDKTTGIGINKKREIVNFEFGLSYFNIYYGGDFLFCKFTEIQDMVFSLLVYLQIQNKSKDSDMLLKVMHSKFKIDYNTIINNANKFLKFITVLEKNAMRFSKEDFPKQQNLFDDLSQVVAYDTNGIPIYDVDNDGFISIDDLKSLGCSVDKPFNYRLVDGVWHKIFDPTAITDEYRKEFLRSIKTILYMLEKNEHNEIYSYIFLLHKDLVDSSFDFIKEDEEKISSYGFDISILVDELLFLKLMFKSLEVILVSHNDYLEFLLSDKISLNSKNYLASDSFDFEMIINGVFIELYLNTLNNDTRIDVEAELRDMLNVSLGLCFDAAYDFKLLIKNIKETDIFNSCLEEETTWLDEKLPFLKDNLKATYK